MHRLPRTNGVLAGKTRTDTGGLEEEVSQFAINRRGAISVARAISNKIYSNVL